jgi:GNAT superfamily N-acetyltransferase
MRFESGGDAVPGGYNGYFLAFVGEEVAGYLDYQSCVWQGEQCVAIAMVHVNEGFRRQGVATALLARLREEFPGVDIDPGMLTGDGAAWWAAANTNTP